MHLCPKKVLLIQVIKTWIRITFRTAAATIGSCVQLEAARVLLRAGDYDSGIQELDSYLSARGHWSIEGLQGDPIFEPILKDARFTALLEKYFRQ